MTTASAVLAQRGSRSKAPREYFTTTRLVTLDELHNLDASPLELVPAPGAGRLLVPLSAVVKSEGGVGMDMANGNLAVMYGDRSSTKGNLFASMPNVGGFDHPFVAVLTPTELIDATENSPLMLTTDILGGGEIGDGYPFEIRLQYEIVEL